LHQKRKTLFQHDPDYCRLTVVVTRKYLFKSKEIVKFIAYFEILKIIVIILTHYAYHDCIVSSNCRKRKSAIEEIMEVGTKRKKLSLNAQLWLLGSHSVSCSVG